MEHAVTADYPSLNGIASTLLTNREEAQSQSGRSQDTMRPISYSKADINWKHAPRRACSILVHSTSNP